MRIITAVFGTIALASVWAYADPSVIIRERAKELRDQNNVRQGVAPPTQAAQPTVTPNAPLGPTLSRHSCVLTPNLWPFQSVAQSQRIKAKTGSRTCRGDSGRQTFLYASLETRHGCFSSL